VEPADANSLPLVRFGGNDSSVPTAYAHHPITVVGGLGGVRLACRDRLVARHRRHRGKEHAAFGPAHYLALLERKPGAFDVARPLVGWALPADFGVLRRRLEAAWGEAGVRHVIQALRLLEKCSLGELTAAVGRALATGAAAADAARVAGGPVALFRLDGRPHPAVVTAPRPGRVPRPAGRGRATKKTGATSAVLLTHHLQALKLPTMLAECEKAARRCATGNADRLACLRQLAELGLPDRERRAAERRLKAARLAAVKTLDDSDFAAQPPSNRVLVAGLMRCAFLDRRESVILLGSPGAGKSHAATALAAEACRRGKKVRFWRATELVTQLLEAREERVLPRPKAQLARLDLLVLDEFGYVPASTVGAELLFDVIGTADEQTSVIATTSLPFEQWAEVPGGERPAGATLDRLTHRRRIPEATGESYRLRGAKRRPGSEAGSRGRRSKGEDPQEE
jgi:DNA replication protein DnaC